MKASVIIFLSSLFLFVPQINGQVLPKSIDGTFTDWNNSDFSIDDAGDSQELDIMKVSVSNDAERLYILLEASFEFDMQDEEDISIFIDADNNPNTGFPRGGIGAEITYYYGARRGFINNPDGSSIQVNHNPIGALSSPTVTSTVFEMALNRSVAEGGFSATMANTISILVENDSTGDLVPNTSGGFQYTMSNNPTFESAYNLDKDPNHTRFLSYNVLNDGITSPDRQEEFEKILVAMNPDVIALQEVNGTSANEVRNILNNVLPLPSNQDWDVAKSNPDIIVATRYEIEAWDNIDGNAVFLLFDENDEPIIVYNVHLPCCANDAQRQDEIDNLLSVLRDKEASPQTGFSYPEDAPTIITGDFNMVGLRQNYDSFINGDIVDNNTYGQDFAPDWDGSILEDADPGVTGFPGNYTWNNPNGSYHPGKLDLLFYTGSVMQARNGFVLDTEYLTATELSNYNLASNTTTLASDHLPVVIDFTFGVEQLEDADGDSFTSDVDCNDNDPSIFPGAPELCDQVDNNCNGMIDEGIAMTTFYVDSDMDGFGDPNNFVVACQQPPGTSLEALDCDDSNPMINPGADEMCNGIDDNCNGMIDDNDPDLQNATIWYQDNDGDGYGNPTATVLSCSMPQGYTSDSFDCDDTNPEVNLNAQELCNGIDDNCDGLIDDQDPTVLETDVWFQDLDNDGFGNPDIFLTACLMPVGYINNNQDCDDNNELINPDAPENPNNGIDENCDGVDSIIDEDQDGFNSVEDCNDTDASINPSATEICDGVDNNCDGMIDEGFTLTSYFLDNDADGFGDDNTMIASCSQPMGYVTEGGDCDDASANIYPGAPEICDDLDNNCNGTIDEGLSFLTYYPDVDMDGFGDEMNPISACEQPTGSITQGGDCDDTSATVFPGAPEILDNDIDEDCDGADLSDIHEIDGLIFNIYPNPVREKIFIDVNENIPFTTTFIDVNGKLILSQKMNGGSNEIDVTDIPNGVYFLLIKGGKQEFVITDRIVRL